MHILLLVLKIIGLLAGILLLILLCLLFLVFFAPVRYRAEVFREDETEGSIRISWLFPLLSCLISYEKGEGNIRVRILGIPFGRRGKKKKKTKPRKRGPEQGKREPLTVSELGGGKQEEPDADTEAIKNSTSGKESVSQKPQEKESINRQSQEMRSVDRKSEEQKSVNRPPQEKNSETTGGKESDPKEREEKKGERQKLEKQVEPKRSQKERKKEAGGSRGGFVFRHPLKKAAGFLKDLRRRLSSLMPAFLGFRNKVGEIRRFFQLMAGKGGVLRAFLQEEGNRRGFGRMFLAFQGIVKHCNPQKAEGWVQFGLDDPADTGILLGYASVFYGLAGGRVELLPDFERRVLKGAFMVKGRVRVFTLVRICITLWLDQDFQWLKKSLFQLKEELIHG